MWIFLAELVGYEKDSPVEPKVLMAMGMAPPEDSKITDISDDEDLLAEISGGDDDDEDDDDDLGFNDYEDGLSDDDMSSFDNYDY